MRGLLLFNLILDKLQLLLKKRETVGLKIVGSSTGSEKELVMTHDHTCPGHTQVHNGYGRYDLQVYLRAPMSSLGKKSISDSTVE